MITKNTKKRSTFAAKKMPIKYKIDLIENVREKLSEQEKLVKKIVRQVKLAKKPEVALKVEWEKLTEHLKELIKNWQKKQIQAAIEQFLEEMKLNLREKNSIVLQEYFSLRVRWTPERKAINPLTKEKIDVKGQNRISFRASPNLRREIN